MTELQLSLQTAMVERDEEELRRKNDSVQHVHQSWSPGPCKGRPTGPNVGWRCWRRSSLICRWQSRNNWATHRPLSVSYTTPYGRCNWPKKKLERKAALLTESNALRQQLQRADDRLYHSKPCNRQKRAYTTVDKKLSTSQSKAARSDLWARNIVLVARNADLEHHVQRLQVAVGQRQELQDEAALLSIQMERRQRRAV